MEETYEQFVVNYLKTVPNIHPDRIPKQILLIEEDDKLTTKITIKVESIERSNYMKIHKSSIGGK